MSLNVVPQRCLSTLSLSLVPQRCLSALSLSVVPQRCPSVTPRIKVRTLRDTSKSPHCERFRFHREQTRRANKQRRIARAYLHFATVKRRRRYRGECVPRSQPRDSRVHDHASLRSPRFAALPSVTLPLEVGSLRVPPLRDCQTPAVDQRAGSRGRFRARGAERRSGVEVWWKGTEKGARSGGGLGRKGRAGLTRTRAHERGRSSREIPRVHARRYSGCTVETPGNPYERHRQVYLGGRPRSL
ncbi:hypothetical protein PUN28_001787 [Cardiocondyla obscurior]|uniref:Uncharacterized protein n=1 Tax=Cardiocondyla obscurior TaxID=286306 RepID=A0AAW2GR52_9HYME